METWNDFLALSEDDQATVVFKWETEYNDPDITGIGDYIFRGGNAWGNDPEKLDELTTVFNRMLRSCPCFRKLDGSDRILTEYRQTGHVQACTHCGKKVSVYGYAFRVMGSLFVVCPECGVIGHHFGPREIHSRAKPGNVQVWDEV